MLMNQGNGATYSKKDKRAVLRPDRTPASPELVVDFRRGLTMELRQGDAVLAKGDCAPSVTIDGGRRPLAGGWEEVCWISDEDADYLELDAPLGDGWSVQRHILMARKDVFLFLADAILAPGAKRIEHALALPLPAGATFVPAKETHEGSLLSGRALARVLPLSLPEWRSDPDPSSLEERDGRLVLSQSRAGCRLFAPLFIDLHPRRRKLEVTWRRLTVAKMLEIEPPDVAVGYRAQVGARQWLFYRSLADEDNRTVLGHNLSSEFLAARFSTSGDVDSLVEVENE
jgi:hypothetical protein